VSPGAARLEAVRARIARAAERAGRDPASVSLVGVSKRQPAERVAAAVHAGLRDVGESYVQEAAAKQPRVHELLGATAPPRWHLVGRLQRNKAGAALRLFDVIHSVDRSPLAEELSRRAVAAGRRIEVCLQVDLAGELQKGGAPPEAVADLLDLCAALPGLAVVGLMTVPPLQTDPEASRPYFACLRRLRDRLRERASGAGLRELSMGMSADLEPAVEEGATWVRVGTALFGAREGGDGDGG
jgi:hypothetical protein